ncbi:MULTISPECIES: DUF2564 family protein [Bacillaceae]|uniref:DUF2564 family protein n=1 Tax=Metabacillus sediminis TaxID=3117746 RepID=A0ABZ2NC04_9BACI|nr:DUF2564 family protein [Bacillus sp. SJS]KZZ82549.1 hypothetical protein AS29_020580 [Bacillus sp. SJS]
MEQFSNEKPVSGLNDLAQLELAVEASQKMTGSSTMSMDPESLSQAQKSIEDARSHLEQVKLTGVDQVFLENQKKLLDQCQHQLNEAKK